MDNTIDNAALSEEVMAGIRSTDESLQKRAALAASEYLRTEIREDAVYRQIIPTRTVTADEFDRDEKSDFPSIIIDVAPKSSGAMRVPFETGPEGEVLHARKIRAEFGRIMTKKYAVDRLRLLTWQMPILDIFYDLLLKDMMDAEDVAWHAKNVEIVGTKNTADASMGVKRWVECGALDRDAMIHVKKGMKAVPGGLIPTQQLMNDLTYMDFGGLTRDEVGGDLSQDMFINGVTLTKVMGLNTVVTNKNELIETNDTWVFTDQKFYGWFLLFEDVSMVTEMIDNITQTFFGHEVASMTIGNVAAVCRGTFTGSRVSWT